MPTTEDLDQQTFPTLLYINEVNKNQTNDTGATKLYSMKITKTKGSRLTTITE
jgi:hypothetical protein